MRAIECWQALETGKYGPLFTSDYIFNEVIGVTTRKVGKKHAIIIGEKIIASIFIINIDDHLLRNAWDFFVKTKSAFNLVDCTTVVTTQLGSMEYIATFDKEFEKIKEITVIK